MGVRVRAVAPAAILVCLAACSPAVSAPASTISTTESSMSAAGSASPTLDPSRFGAAARAPGVTIRGSESGGGVTVTDLTFGDEDEGQTEAYLVEPDAGGQGLAILFFHWLEYGSPTSNRTEFLDESRSLARRGVVSLLVQGTLPWLDRPASIAHDVPLIEREVRMAKRGLDLLLARPDVDPERVAAVGHDFGGMYETLLFGSDSRVRALVLMTPTARWGDWFVRYWQIEDAEADYLAALASLDPVAWLSRADGRPILLQFAKNDQYVPEEVAAEITAAAGPTAMSRTYEAGHELDAEARADREAWLAEQMGLPPAG